MKTKLTLALVLYIVFSQLVICQISIDSTQIKREYSNLNEALKNPEKVYRLNLSNQNIELPKETWSKFINLEYLSFKNDHLKEIPKEIALLKNLKVLDLSGNDFKTLPLSFSELSNLEELFLNDEKNMILYDNIEIISLLPHLRVLHLENDNLSNLPKNIFKLTNLESLFLNHNNFKQIPKGINGLDHLQYLDLNDNKIKPELQDLKNLNFGFKINF